MATSKSRIARLASTVATCTQQIDDYLNQNSLPHPSFDANAPLHLGLPPHIEQLRTEVLDATQELNDLLREPRDILFDHHHNQLVYFQLITRFDIAKKVPIDGEITYGDLAARVGVDESALCRIIRFGIAHRVFLEPRPGVIVHSAASKQIAVNRVMADWTHFNVDVMLPAANYLVEALAKWPLAEEPNQTGFCLGYNTENSFYTELTKDPERARIFSSAMTFLTTGDDFALHHLTDNYPFGDLGTGTVVDVGGSRGDVGFAIARKYPDLHLVVEDLPKVSALSKEEPGVNVKFVAHDFFNEQPVKDADVYIYRWCLHNWPDKYCTKALRALIPALKKGAKVLIMEFVMPPPSVLPNLVERRLRAMDVTMLEIGNAKERTLEEWKDLFEKTDERFEMKGVVQPPGSRLSILEFEWLGEGA
ncbi:putative O-methyltransferase [Poronia punctata]|nr:putative O-methyltransferase [Poronia punctata]